MGQRNGMVAAGVAVVLVAVAVVWALVTGLTGPGGPVGGDGGRAAPPAAPTVALPPVTGAPEARLAVAGDTGTGDEKIRATVDAMVAEAGDQGPYDALVLLGEEQILARLGRDRSWYVEEVGPVRLVALDTTRVDEPRQTRWLETTLAADDPPGTWTVVALHHPPFSAGDHGSDLEVRRAWVPLFERFDVALVLAGHDHDYQRSRPIDGVTYVVSGGAARLRPTGREDFTEVSTSTRHYLDLAVYDDRIVGRAVDQSGDVLDEFTVPGP